VLASSFSHNFLQTRAQNHQPQPAPPPLSMPCKTASAPSACATARICVAALRCTTDTSTTTNYMWGTTARILPCWPSIRSLQSSHCQLRCGSNPCTVDKAAPGSKEQIMVHPYSLSARYADHELVREGRCGQIPAISGHNTSSSRHAPKSNSVMHAACKSSIGQLQSRSHWEHVQKHGCFPAGAAVK
jgi:hypothetical protein